MLNKGKASVTIESIVDDLPPINYKQVLYEAITNSIQADATNISIKFIYNILEFDKKDIQDKEKVLESIEIIDNGIGFTYDNIEAFKEYKTKNKFGLGCKGVGRFLYLKLFEKVEILSLDKKIDFIINKDIQATPQDNKIDKTIVKLSKAKSKITIDYQKLKDDLKEHFIAYFKLLKDKNKKVEIIIYKDNDKQFNIKSDDIPKFKDKSFMIGTHKFILNYVFNDKELLTEGYYCAGKRVVKKNSELEASKKIRFSKHFSFLFLLEADYLDENVRNDTRDDFTIYPKRKNSKDLYGSISWEEIKEKLKLEIEDIARYNNIDLEQIAKSNLENAIKTVPYLGFYLKDNNSILDSEELIKEAKAKLEADKRIIRENKEVNSHKLSIVTQSELAEYIFDRQVIIDNLKKLTDKKVIEKEIHNLFMKKYTKDEDNNYKSNNLWLFDDRFMTYDKIFSETQLKEIFPKLSQNLRPDILSIVSNTYDKEKITDIVIIELKRPNENITPVEAQRQLRSYADYINHSREFGNKIRIWAYAFLSFNPDTERDLRLDEYNTIPTQSQYPIYYKYSQATNIIINFLDYTAIAFDADIRNKTFMKILSGKSRR